MKERLCLNRSTQASAILENFISTGGINFKNAGYILEVKKIYDHLLKIFICLIDYTDHGNPSIFFFFSLIL